jgi:hypothetical protein
MGDDWRIERVKKNRSPIEFVEGGNWNPGDDVPSIVPKSKGTVTLPTPAVTLAPVNLKVNHSAPTHKVRASDPDWVQVINWKQDKFPVVVTDVLKMRSPLGRIV